MPANANVDGLKLQLAMAFGQGAGVMLANVEALETLLAERRQILTNAMETWAASQWAFTELLRTLGQLSATHAAAAGSPEIRWTDIEASLAPVLTLCPCFDPGARVRKPKPRR